MATISKIAPALQFATYAISDFLSLRHNQNRF
jgi:hypothetical protein